MNSSDTVQVFWEPIDLANELHLDFVNSYDFLSFEVTVEPVYPSLSQISSTQQTVMKPGDNATFTLTNDDFLVFKVGISVTNNFGTGPKQNSCFALGENGEFYELNVLLRNFSKNFLRENIPKK